MKIQCCVCRRIRVGLLFWIRLWRAPRRASHTYCPRCADETRAAWNLPPVPAPRKWPFTVPPGHLDPPEVGRFHSDLSSDSSF